ncbi:MAG: hypothetical protein ABH864_03395 [archaeon]
MGKAIIKLAGTSLFLIAALIFLGFLGEVHQIVKSGDALALILIILGLAVSIAAGIFFIRTKKVKDLLVNASAWLIFAPLIAFILAVIVLIAVFTISGAKDPLGLGILLSLLAMILGGISTIGLIILVVYLIKNKQ